MDRPSELPEIKILISFLVLIVLLVLGTGVAYLRLGISLSEVRVILLGIGILANLLLVSAYVLTLIHDRREDIRQREKPLQKDTLSKVVEPSIEATKDNSRRFITPEYASGPFNLTRFDFFFERDEYLRGYIFIPLFEYDSRTLERVKETDPGIISLMEYHDEQLYDILETEYQLKMDITESILRKVDREEARGVNLDGLSTLLVRQFEPGNDHPEYDFWIDHREEIVKVYQEFRSSNDDYRNYLREKTGYSNLADNLEERLRDYEEEVRGDYGISYSRSGSIATSEL